VTIGHTKARYIRVTAANIGTCPPGHKAAGAKAWLFIDEIMVE
jgi:hexosaminidase